MYLFVFVVNVHFCVLVWVWLRKAANHALGGIIHRLKNLIHNGKLAQFGDFSQNLMLVAGAKARPLGHTCPHQR